MKSKTTREYKITDEELQSCVKEFVFQKANVINTSMQETAVVDLEDMTVTITVEQEIK